MLKIARVFQQELHNEMTEARGHEFEDEVIKSIEATDYE